MNRSRKVRAALAAGLLGCGVVIAMVHTASPGAAPQPQRFDLAAALPRFAPGYRLSLTRAVIPAGTALPPHRHPGMQVAYVQSGTLDFRVFRGKVNVYRGNADGSQKRVRSIAAGQSGPIHTGEWIVETPSVWHRGANSGTGRVVILLATLLRAKQPAAIPVTPQR